MSETEQMSTQWISLSPHDLEAALRLLSIEEQAAHVSRTTLIANFLLYISCGFIFLACPLGLLTVGVNQVVGWTLLIVAGVAFVIFGVSRAITEKSIDFRDAVRAARDTLKGSTLTEAVDALWERRSRPYYIVIGCFFLPTIIVCLVGCGWFLYGVVIAREVRLLGLLVIALPILLLYVGVAVQQYQEFRYFSQVSRLQSRLQQARGEAVGDISVSVEDVDFLAQVETHQLKREIAKVTQAATQVGTERPLAYSVAIAPAPLAYLRSLPEHQRAVGDAIREVTDSLQLTPRPLFARPQGDHADELVISQEEFKLTYRVDDARQRVDILTIATTPHGEVDNVA